MLYLSSGERRLGTARPPRPVEFEGWDFMAYGLKRQRVCLYCGAQELAQFGTNGVQCEACGRRMELARFEQKTDRLAQEIERTRRAAEHAEKLVREAMSAQSSLGSFAQQVFAQTEQNHRMLYAELEQLTSFMKSGASRSLSNSFALGEIAQRKGDFAEAIRHYEYVIRGSEIPEAEVHWRIALCSRGVEYVHERETNRWLPTITHMVMDSLLENEHYKAAIRFARTEEVRAFYRSEAQKIERILEKYRVIYSQEKKYDVFISVKQEDAGGRPTRDSITAMQLYSMLTGMGLRVFNSQVSLAEHAGDEYEPYIMAALMSSKVMIVVGHSGEYMNAPWVRNEWRRYRWLKENSDAERRLVAYMVGMETADTPRELGEFQAINATYDLNPLGTLREVIEQAFPRKRPNRQDEQDNLLTRAAMHLRQGDFARADAFCEQALNKNARNARAYVLKLCIDLRVCVEQELAQQNATFENNVNYRFALECADPQYRSVIEGYSRSVADRLERIRKEKAEAEARARREVEARIQREAAERLRRETEEARRREEQRKREEEAAARRLEEQRRREEEEARRKEELKSWLRDKVEQLRREEDQREAQKAQERREAAMRARRESTDKRCIDAATQLCQQQRFSEAYAMLMNASENAVAQNFLGNMCRMGVGVEKNDAQAFKWFSRSAGNGNRDAQFSLGKMYEEGCSVEKNDAEAAKWYRLAVRQGCVAAALPLGRMYRQGRGVPVSDEEAVRCFRMAADQGDSEALLDLGWMYERGRGVSCSEEEAFRLYRQSANSGNRNAQFNVGWMFENGRFVRRNDEEAAKWYRLSAEQGNPRAQYSLGVMYEEGRGVPRNTLEARRLYGLAAAQGNASAKEKLNRS